MRKTQKDIRKHKRGHGTCIIIVLDTEIMKNINKKRLKMNFNLTLQIPFSKQHIVTWFVILGTLKILVTIQTRTNAQLEQTLI